MEATVTSYFQPPQRLTRIEGPEYSNDSDISESYDYSGLDEQLKRQDEIGKLHNAKYGQLYEGDIPGSVAAGQRIRGLLKQVRAFAPNATEQDPFQTVKPLVLPDHYSSSTGSSTKGPVLEGEGHQPLNIPNAPIKSHMPFVKNPKKPAAAVNWIKQDDQAQV
jgi:hypothetical protein